MSLAEDPRVTKGWYSQRHATRKESEELRGESRREARERKQAEAQQRAAKRAELSPAQQQYALGARLETDGGAQKERQRLLAQEERS